jgi:hypothetical protein
MTQCEEGHENPDGQAFCGTCGEPLDGEGTELRTFSSASTLAADAIFVFASVIAVGCLVMFIASLFAAGDVNSRDKFTTYAFIAGAGGAMWLVAAIAAWGLAAWRATVILGD